MKTKPAALALFLLSAMALAACAHRQSLAELLATPAGQSDPLGTLRKNGFAVRSEVYQATVIVLNQGVPSNSPGFPRAVNAQIRQMEQGGEMGSVLP